MIQTFGSAPPSDVAKEVPKCAAAVSAAQRPAGAEDSAMATRSFRWGLSGMIRKERQSGTFQSPLSGRIAGPMTVMVINTQIGTRYWQQLLPLRRTADYDTYALAHGAAGQERQRRPRLDVC